MKTLLIRIALIVLLLAALFVAHSYDKRTAVSASYTKGKRDAMVEYLQKDVANLTSIITSAQTLIDAANAISNALETAIALRQSQDQKTTQEIHRALTRTAATRANCHFDDDVMQQLTAARNRANQAAATGISNTMPAGTGTD